MNIIELFYNKYWNVNNIPDFIKKNIFYKEFAFDPDGMGPRVRYRKFTNLNDLDKYVKHFKPYAIYTSVTYYLKPEKRLYPIGAELVFDFDVKEFELKNCCEKGRVCDKCLTDVKEYVAIFVDALKTLDFKEIYIVYSGRGYHIRVNDDIALQLDEFERELIMKYITASELLEIDELFSDKVYAEIFRRTMIAFLKRCDFAKDMKTIERKFKDWLIYYLEKKDFDTIKRKYKGLINRIVELTKKYNETLLDGKVTKDLYRILRLPGSLNVKARAICVLIKNLDKFNPEDVKIK